MGILGVFGSPVLITLMIIRHRRGKQPSVSDTEAAQLRAEMTELRHEVETTLADVTLMLADLSATRQIDETSESHLPPPDRE